MLEKDESRGFEWLDRPFILTRILITLVGAIALVLLAGALFSFASNLFPPKPKPWSMAGEEEDRVIHFCGVEPHRGEALLGAAISTALPIGGMICVWRRPRWGFLLVAVGYVPFGVEWSTTFRGSENDSTLLRSIVGVLPFAWLCFAAWKVGPFQNEKATEPPEYSGGPVAR